MIIILLFGIHLLLMTIYAWMVMTKRSRLNMQHLLLALCLPFIGEICLLAAEIGEIPSGLIYRSELKKKKKPDRPVSDWQCPDNWKDIILGEESTAREFLMKAIESSNPLLPEILLAGLTSPSSEISHISASKLMNMHRNSENKINKAREDSNRYPDNMSLLATHIDAIDAYRTSGLADPFLCETLTRQELSLLKRYLRNMPNDLHYAKLSELLSGTESET